MLQVVLAMMFVVVIIVEPEKLIHVTTHMPMAIAMLACNCQHLNQVGM